MEKRPCRPFRKAAPNPMSLRSADIRERRDAGGWPGRPAPETNLGEGKFPSFCALS